MQGSLGHHLIVVHYFLLLILPVDSSSETNVALGRQASQSSTYEDSLAGVCVAGRAVDGDPDPKFNNGHCSATKDDPGGPNWWRVDLEQPMNIKQIVITNRGDKRSYANRLDYFLVGVTNTTAAPVRGAYALCGQYPSKAAFGARHYLQCNPSIASGRYVIVQQPISGTGLLSMCEIKIYTGQVRRTGTWRRQSGWRLMTNGTISLKKRSPILCISACELASACDSINYFGKEKKCELNFLPRGAVSGDLVEVTGWHWWTQVYEFL